MRSLALSLLTLLPALAAAEEPAATATTAAPPAEAAPAPSAEYAQDFRGIFLHGTYVSDDWGRAIPLQLGVQWQGVRSFSDRAYLFTFDGAANFFAAYGGNSSERFYLLGGQLRVLGEVGKRFAPASGLSPYVGGTLDFDGNGVGALGWPLDGTKNSLAGIAGLYGRAGLRVNGGLSLLSGDAAFLVTAFVAEVLRAPGSAQSGPLFTDLGVRAQFDLVKSFSAALELTWGTTFGRVDALGVTNTGTYWQVTALAKKRLGPIWIALDGKVHGSTNTAVTKPNTYVTATPSWISAGAALGVNL
ncbi:MAG: hypothetical protein U0228_36775 [Myxococcaceae bacterium]